MGRIAFEKSSALLSIITYLNNDLNFPTTKVRRGPGRLGAPIYGVLTGFLLVSDTQISSAALKRVKGVRESVLDA
jgi:hypothetical protein